MFKQALAVLLAGILLSPAAALADSGVGDVSTVAKALTATEATPTHTIPVGGRTGVHVSWPSNTLDGTLVAECSPDGGTNWNSAHLADPVSGVISLSVVGDGNNDADSYRIIPAGAVTHCGVRLSAYTSGTISPTVWATNSISAQPYLLGSDGTNLRAPVVTNSQPAGTEYGLGVWLIGNSAAGTSTADDADHEAGTTAGTIAQGVYESTPSSVTDGDVGSIGITQKRGVKVVVYTPAGDSAMDDTNDAVKTSPVTVVTVGGKSADATTTNYINCTQQANLRMTSATTTRLITATADERVYVCSMIIYTDAATDVTIVEGTGTNCGTGQSTLIGGFDFAANQGLALSGGNVPLFDGGAESNDICITNSAAANVVIFMRYADFPD